MAKSCDRGSSCLINLKLGSDIGKRPHQPVATAKLTLQTVEPVSASSDHDHARARLEQVPTYRPPNPSRRTDHNGDPPIEDGTYGAHQLRANKAKGRSRSQ